MLPLFFLTVCTLHLHAEGKGALFQLTITYFSKGDSEVQQNQTYPAEKNTLTRTAWAGAAHRPNPWKKHIAVGLACHVGAVMESIFRYVHTGPDQMISLRFQLPAVLCWVLCGYYHTKNKRNYENSKIQTG